MFLILQFPLTDSRKFLNLGTGKLNRPNWPTPSVDDDFLRSFGQIRLRRRGGLTGWVGENNICDAKRAIRFINLSPFVNKTTGKSYQPKIAFRRFYSDGMATGKFEIGIKFEIPDEEKLSVYIIKDIIVYISQLLVAVPLKNRRVNCKLIDAGRNLAILYVESTTKTMFVEGIQGSWVKASRPMLMVLSSEKGFEKNPFFGKELILNSCYDTKLWCSNFLHNGRSYPVWFCPEDKANLIIRPLRVYIARLYAEKESLKKILENIASGVIKVEPRSAVSIDLQFYFNEATRRIATLESNTEKLSENSSAADLARSAMELIAPGEKDEILNALKSIDVRLNVLRKIEKFVNQIVIKENIMGDKYTVGQAGAVGPNAHAHDMNFHQLWNNSEDKFDLSKLANELSLLREKMKEQSTKPEHDTSVGAVASAEMAAKDGNGAKVFENLAKAGQWALDVATKIGVGLATQALKTALGI